MMAILPQRVVDAIISLCYSQAMADSKVVESVKALEKGSAKLALASNEARSSALHAIARAIDSGRDLIHEENRKDIERAEAEGIPFSKVR